jgi:diadenosine tetraphosphatase ApaH/serine/threonine PP2A family protein phosphatase
MKISVLSDVHGNLEALNAVLADIASQNADQIVFLGDAVGYGADPEACVVKIREKADVVLAGNHDHAVALGSALDEFNPEARASLECTRSALTASCRSYLAGLPLWRSSRQIMLTHGSPAKPEQWDYVLNTGQASRAFAACPHRLMFVGHSHVPGIFVELEYKRMFAGEIRRVEQISSDQVLAEEQYRYLFDVGSVGQPRDHDPRASYGLYDSEAEEYQLIRVSYDVDTAAAKIRSAGLPDASAERLFQGQ